jgi:hypothetical protein
MRLLSLACLPLLAACSGAADRAALDAPPATAVQAAGIRASVARLTAPRLVETTPAGPQRFRIFKVEDGAGEVVVAKKAADGTVTTKCVESADDAFLGDGAGREAAR